MTLIKSGLALAILFAGTIGMASDVASLLKELEQELSALDAPTTAKPVKAPTQTFKALAIPAGGEDTAAARDLDAKLSSLKGRIASQRQHLASHFSAIAPSAENPIATIQSSGDQLLTDAGGAAITNLRVYLDDVLVFAAEPIASLAAEKITLYENPLPPREYQLKVTGSRLVSAGDVMRLEDFTIKAPWPIGIAQKKHLALLRPMLSADGKATLEVLFD